MRRLQNKICIILAGFLAGFLAGCSGASTEGNLIPANSSDADARRAEILIASTRVRSDKPYLFTHERSSPVNYQKVELSIPANHRAGSIEKPRQGPGNPATEFTALSNIELNKKEFETRASTASAKGKGEVTVFVHGFNTTHEQAVFILGQIVVDADTSGAFVVFSWPSRGRVLDYLTDRESAMFSRDRLELVLRSLAKQPGVRRINILAHSMGAFLTMETLRQAKLRGDGEFSGKLNAVVLASPDIDLDVFRSQLDVIGKRSKPMIVLGSRDDRALAWSRFLSGDVERLGVANPDSIEAKREIVERGLTVIDLTAVEGNDPDNHSKFAARPETVKFVGLLIDGGKPAIQGEIIKLNRNAGQDTADNR